MFNKAKAYPDSRRIRGQSFLLEDQIKSQIRKNRESQRNDHNISAMGQRIPKVLENLTADPQISANNRTQNKMHNHISARITRDMTPNPMQKRQLPVIPKKGVFNEWAAVMRNQDEMEKEQERQEYVRNKIRQDEYRKSLEDQIKYQRNQYTGLANTHKGQEKNLVENQWRQDHLRQNMEMAEMMQKKKQAIEMAQESIHKAQIQKQKDKAVKIAENNRKLFIICLIFT